MHRQIRSAVLLRTAYATAAVLVFLFFLMFQLNFYLAENLKQGVYLFVVPVLVTGVLYYRGLRDGAELRLMVLYMVWAVVSRILCGDTALNRGYLFLLDLSLMLPMLLLGLVLDRAGRRRVLNWLSVVLGLYFFALGCLAVASFLLGREFVNPITGGYFSSVYCDIRRIGLSSSRY